MVKLSWVKRSGWVALVRQRPQTGGLLAEVVPAGGGAGEGLGVPEQNQGLGLGSPTGTTIDGGGHAQAKSENTNSDSEKHGKVERSTAHFGRCVCG